MRIPLLLACLAWAAAPARAIFIENEMEVVDPEPLFDSEYFLDLLGFSYPLDWDLAWSASSSGYRVGGASLDRTDLLLEQEVRLPRRLAEKLHFRYDLRQRADKDLSELHQWLAFEAGPWAGFSAGVFGEPTFEKQDSDIGFLLRWRRGALTLSGSVLAVDFPFNERGTSGERYARKPYTYELGAALGPLRARLEHDSPLTREVAATARSYRYRRSRASLGWLRRSGRSDWSAEYSFEDKLEAETFSPASASDQGFHRRVHGLHAAHGRPLGERDRLEAGLRWMLRRGRADFANAPHLSSRHRRWELMPYARWRRLLAPWLESEAAFFLSAGERRRLFSEGGPSASETPVEAKTGLGLEFLFGPRGRLGLYGTFDLDDLDRHAWDGGAVRLMVFFD